MIISYAERSNVYDGEDYCGVDPLGATSRKDRKKHLVALGWQRAGALMTLFAELWGLKPGPIAPVRRQSAGEDGLACVGAGCTNSVG